MRNSPKQYPLWSEELTRNFSILGDPKGPSPFFFNSFTHAHSTWVYWFLIRMHFSFLQSITLPSSPQPSSRIVEWKSSGRNAFFARNAITKRWRLLFPLIFRRTRLTSSHFEYLKHVGTTGTRCTRCLGLIHATFGIHWHRPRFPNPREAFVNVQWLRTFLTDAASGCSNHGARNNLVPSITHNGRRGFSSRHVPDGRTPPSSQHPHISGKLRFQHLYTFRLPLSHFPPPLDSAAGKEKQPECPTHTVAAQRSEPDREKGRESSRGGSGRALAGCSQMQTIPTLCP